MVAKNPRRSNPVSCWVSAVHAARKIAINSAWELSKCMSVYRTDHNGKLLSRDDYNLELALA